MFKYIYITTGLVILLLSLTVNAELRTEVEGRIVYFVSDSNKLIHIEVPFKTDFTLIDNHVSDDNMRYAINVYGTVDFDKNSRDYHSILAKYPEYRVSTKFGSISVAKCKITFPSGLDIPCETPPGIGTYFSASMILISKAEGDKLKSDFKKGLYPAISVTVKYEEPFVISSDKIVINLLEFYKALIPLGGEVSLEQVVNQLAKSAVDSQLKKDSPLFSNALKNIMNECLGSISTPNYNISSFDQLLDTKVALKKPVNSSKVIEIDELGWHEVLKQAVNVIHVKET